MNRKVSSGNHPKCPYIDCSERFQSFRKNSNSPTIGSVVRKGSFFRSSDGKRIVRFLCRNCKRSFSNASNSPCYWQKKRRLNKPIFELLVSGVSQRRIARLLKINRNTVVRKLLFLADQAKLSQQEFLESLRDSKNKVTSVQFDEMETFERSKCLPLSIPLIVEAESRKILSFRVAQMPAKGPLAEISRKKYGKREDHRAAAVDSLLSELSGVIQPKAQMLSDQNPKYPNWVKRHFPSISHEAVKGRRGCVVGQGELKKIGNDPLFDLNHTCAMLRANVNRLFRRTWCTTKRPDRLEAHLAIYVAYHNQVLTASRD